MEHIKILNVDVWGIQEALIRAGYPMSTEIKDMNDVDVDKVKLIKRGDKLGNSPYGHGDDKFLRQITVAYDIIAPRYWWQQHDTYHWFTKNSMSSMHKVKSLDYKKMANKYVHPTILGIFEDIVEEYIEHPSEENLLSVKSNMPEGICLGAGIVTNYAQLKTIWYQRHNHRLPEWREFCNFISTLPWAEEFGVVGS